MRPKPLRLGKLPGWLVSYMPLARGFPRLLRAASKASRGQDSRSSSQFKRVGTLRGPKISSKSSGKIDKSYKCDASWGVIHHHGHCYDGWWNLDGSRTVPPQPVPKRRRGPGPRRHPAGPPRKHRDPERARARARAAAARRPHHSKWSPRDVAAAIADEVGRNEQKA